jgi:uncharacterized protein GlcG (DUF336 family)
VSFLISSDKALEAIKAAEKKAKDLGITISTVVVDDHGVVIAEKRMDGALVISPDFAYAKAYTSAVLKMPTSGLGEYAAPEKPYFGINDLFGGKLTTIAGGVPVMKGEKVVGAIGVGGSADVSQDEECAKAAAGALS